MPSMLRSILAIVVGFAVAGVVMMLVEFTNGHLLYPELGNAAAHNADPEALRVLLASAPIGALVVVLIGWMLGSFAGGWVTARIAARAKVNHALVLGALLTVLGVANNLMIPPPLWFWIVGMLVFVPAAWFGGRLAAR